jgi:stage IV sporulation protein B
LKPGFKETIKEEEATILSTVEGNVPQEYKIQITKVFKENTSDGKNMMIRITDERLLSKTGGIVQGMSGSPILQNGKIIGAVTHVLVNDPTKGYGIFIENMLSEVFNEGKGINLPLVFSDMFDKKNYNIWLYFNMLKKNRLNFQSLQSYTIL